MEVPGAVHGEADEEVVVVEEPAPFVIEKNAVCLEGVLDTGPGPRIPLLHLQRTPEELQPHQGRFSSLPGNRHMGDAMPLNGLADKLLHHLIGHPEVTVRIQVLFL
jgi:hypothetical protein